MIGYLAANDGALTWPHIASAQKILSASGNNVGNLAFWYTLRRLIEASEIAFITWSAKGLPSNIKLLVIPAANFIGPHANLAPLVQIVKQLDVPTLLVGVGAQAEREDQIPQVNDACIEFLKEVEKRTPWIAVRGEYSAHVCRQLGISKLKVLGCPSVLMNSDQELGEKIQAKIEDLSVDSVAVHAACHKGSLVNVERELVRYVQLYEGSSYIVQRPLEMIAAIYRSPISDDKGKDYMAKLAPFFGFETVAELESFLRRYGSVPTSVDSWSSALRRFSCSINTRIHGTVMAFQAEVPSLCIYHDTRTKELVDRLLLPALGIQAFTEARYNIPRMFKLTKFNGQRFDACRRAIAAEYIDLFSEIGITPSSHLLAFKQRPPKQNAA